jgi:hypothetical protein
MMLMGYAGLGGERQAAQHASPSPLVDANTAFRRSEAAPRAPT